MTDFAWKTTEDKRKFDTLVQLLKYRVLREVATHAWKGDLEESLKTIERDLVPGPKSTLRCCVYKERAILKQRLKLAMGKDMRGAAGITQVIEIACDGCPAAGHEVTASCRGCLAHRCEEVCKRGAIIFDDKTHTAIIDKPKCVDCGACAKVCPYNAIVNRQRPCQIACKIKAISINDDEAAQIDYSKCTSCGACVSQCPFGAITDKSFILDVIEILKNSQKDNSNIYAMLAPSFSSQFSYAKNNGQVISGLKRLGFGVILEAALGADMVAQEESKELAERGFLTSSCCPAFVNYVKTSFPELEPHVSTTLSPMAQLARHIKNNNPKAKIIFIGPCTAKKAEAQLDSVKPYVDVVITFEELQALFDSRDIDITTLSSSTLDNASYFGRIFARCGGLSDAVAEGLKEQGVDFEVKPQVCDGIEECRKALLLKKANRLDANFIEGMACKGGCIGGSGCLTHNDSSRIKIEKFSEEAKEKTILGAISDYIYYGGICGPKD